VSTWSARQVAQIARAGGFTGDSVTHAVALAHAATGLADHHDQNLTYVIGQAERGLWAIKRYLCDIETWDGLFAPVKSAEAAKALYDVNGQSFAWHQSAHGQAFNDSLDLVRAILARPDQGSRGVLQGDFAANARRAAAQAIALRDASNH
jgi:hypothetical protein